MRGLVSYGTYIPHFRLRRSVVAEALGTSRLTGSRSVASYDEDTTTMGVEAARRSSRVAPTGLSSQAGVVFATTTPAYLDKANAAAIHAAIGLPPNTPAYDMVGGQRSAIGAMRAASDAASFGRTTMAVLGDVRSGLPGGLDEVHGGDAAAALLFGDGPNLVDELAHTSTTVEILDRWRLPGDDHSRLWEERFGEQAYLPLVDATVTDGLKTAGLTIPQVDCLVVCGLHARAIKQVPARLGVRPEVVLDDLAATVGLTGAAQPGLLLAHALDNAVVGDVILVVVMADGVDAIVLRATEHLAEHRVRQQTTVADQATSGVDSLSYATFLSWRGELRREPPRRPDPEGPSAPPAARQGPWKFAFTASRCSACSTLHLPPARVCVSCDTVDEMTEERLADLHGTIATYTVDRLAYSLNPPVVAAVIDFDGGGRFQCELTDVDPAEVHIGGRVSMTFRRLFTADGVHNYFWKARPIRSSSEREEY